jgi:pimeloyl-ACP methyl ester carboxylesterase
MSLSRPDRVLGQILLAPAPASAMPLSPELADEWIRCISTRDGYHRFESQFTKNPLPEEALDDCYEAVTRTPELSLRETLRMCAHPGFADKLPSVRVPTLVIGGEHDPIMTPEYLRREIVDKIPGSRLSLLDCGHNLPLEMPVETAAIIEGFVAGLSGVKAAHQARPLH